MRWEDERYVRLYTRNTPEWLSLSWAARGLFSLILREVDRAGILPLGKLGPKGVAIAVNAPWRDVEAPLCELLSDGCVQIGSDDPITSKLIVPNFLTAQEAFQSDASRKRKSREMARAALSVTPRDQLESHGVTKSHVQSQAVTIGHSDPICADPIRTDLKTPPVKPEVDQPAFALVEPPKPRRVKKPAPQGLQQAIEHFRTRWVAAKQPVDGTPPNLDNADVQALIGLLRAHPFETVTAWVDRYLDDGDEWLAKQGHPLRHLPRRVDGYRTARKARDVTRGYAAAPEGVPEGKTRIEDF
jgi:hypothetical protein